MSPLEYPPVATPVDPAELAAELAVAWRCASPNAAPLSERAIALLVSQSALESARWARCFNFNLSGIKSDLSKPHVYLTTTERFDRATALAHVARSTPDAPCELEHADDGKSLKLVVRYHPKHPMCRFRAYGSLAHACLSKLELLSTRYQLALDAAQVGNVEGFVHGLAARGYFTAPESDYLAGVKRHYLEFEPPMLCTVAQADIIVQSFGYDDIVEFQRAMALDPDGKLGPITRTAIRAQLRGSEMAE